MMAETESRLENITGKAVGVALGAGATAACLYNPELLTGITTLGVVGAVIGGLVGAAFVEDCKITNVVAGGAMGSVLGVSIGSGIGAVTNSPSCAILGTIFGGGVGGVSGGILGDFDIIREKLNNPRRFFGRIAAYGLLASALVLGENYMGRSPYLNSNQKMIAPAETNVVEDVKGRVWI
jgi:hypothetical protein